MKTIKTANNDGVDLTKNPVRDLSSVVTYKSVRVKFKTFNKMSKSSNLRNDSGVVNQYCTMKADTISKHRRILKSHTSRDVYFGQVCFILIALFFHSLMYGQNVDIQVNTGSNSEAKDDCAYRIAGICTTEDIGGVEVYKTNELKKGSSYTFLTFKNHNNFSVNVIFEYEYIDYYSTKEESYKREIGTATGTIVLKANEKKKTNEEYNSRARNFKLIVRKLNSSEHQDSLHSSYKQLDSLVKERVDAALERTDKPKPDYSYDNGKLYKYLFILCATILISVLLILFIKKRRN